MAIPSMTLAELVEKGADSDLLREMIGFVCQRMMEFDVEGLCKAAHGEQGKSGTSRIPPMTYVPCRIFPADNA